LKSYLHRISNCQSIEELWEAHTQKMAEFGFDRLIYGFTRYWSGKSLGDPQDFILLTNHDREYTDVFVGEQHYIDAPMFNWALHNEGVGSWGMLAQMQADKTLTPAEQRMMEFNFSMGVTAGYTISFKSVSARSKGAIALTAKKGMSQEEVDAIWDEHGHDIHLMNNVAHLKILSLPYTSPHRVLTKRQLEALAWVGDGKTNQDIAVLMGLASATVEKHLRLARQALAVETTAQAVLKTGLSNQMFILEGLRFRE
jgi:LuxR family transcriptional regulator